MLYLRTIQRCCLNQSDTFKDFLLRLWQFLTVLVIFITILMFFTLITWSINIKNEGFDHPKTVEHAFRYTFLFTLLPMTFICVPIFIGSEVYRYVKDIPLLSLREIIFGNVFVICSYLIAVFLNFFCGWYKTDKTLWSFENHILVSFITTIIVSMVSVLLTSIIFLSIYACYERCKVAYKSESEVEPVIRTEVSLNNPVPQTQQPDLEAFSESEVTETPDVSRVPEIEMANGPFVEEHISDSSEVSEVVMIDHDNEPDNEV